MGSIFGKPSTASRQRSVRQVQYLQNKKTDKKVVKHEQNMQLEFCQWLRDTFPGVHFYSDTASGAFNSQYAKEIHNRQQSDTSLPDMYIFAARRDYHGLALELKPEGYELKMRRDGRTIRVRKDRNGRVIERDYKIRKKGDWASLHIEKQAKRHAELREAGYLAGFVVGLEAAKKAVCWYFEVEYQQQEQLF